MYKKLIEHLIDYKMYIHKILHWTISIYISLKGIAHYLTLFNKNLLFGTL